MKKIISLFLTLILAISISACSSPASDSFKAGTYKGSAKGFSSDIEVEVTLDENKTITAVNVVSSAESADIGEVALPIMVDKVVNTNSTAVDTVATATITSTAFIEAVNAALAEAGLKPEDLVKKEAAATEKTEETLDTDIVIVGAGGAGMVAAITASDQGKSVIIVEKAPIVGGNTSRATGGMNAAETHYQKENNIEDSVALFVEDTMKGGKELNDKELVQTLAENSSEGIDWLDSIGANLSDVGKAGGASTNRSHRPVDADGKIISVGSYLVKAFEETAKSKDNIQFLMETEAKEILVTDGKAVGIKATSANADYTINAKAVVITAGGFGGNLDTVAEIKPELKGYVTTNATTITGDGIKMAEAIGAATVDMEQIQIHPTVVQENGALISESLRGDGAILLNAEGKRFIDETLTRDVVSAGEIQQTNGSAWLIANQAMFDDSKVVQGYVSKGYMLEAKDTAALAEIIGVDEAVIKESLEKWATAIESKEDTEFGRQGLDTVAYNVSEGPYYAVLVAPGVHHTMGGIKINPNAEVINTDGEVIAGLFAAGEVTGGVHGGNRLGGNAVADLVVFGRIAGSSAAEFAK